MQYTSYELEKFYILSNLFYIFYFRQNNAKYKHEYKEQEVTKQIKQQKDNQSSEVVHQIEKIQHKQMQF